MKRFLQFLMPIGVAGVLGPLAGGLAVCLLDAGQFLLNWPLGPVADLFRGFVLYVIFAYILGWPIALLAGLLMSIWMRFRAPGAIAAVAAAVGAVGLLWLAGAANLLGPVPNIVYGSLVLTLGASVVAAIACWLLVRPFASRVTP